MKNLDLIPITIHKAVKETTYRAVSKNLEPGIYPVDIHVRMQGVLKKGEPFTTPVAARANPWRVLACALGKLNTATRKKVIRESLGLTLTDILQLKTVVELDIQEMIAATTTTMQGRITGEVAYSLLMGE